MFALSKGHSAWCQIFIVSVAYGTYHYIVPLYIWTWMFNYFDNMNYKWRKLFSLVGCWSYGRSKITTQCTDVFKHILHASAAENSYSNSICRLETTCCLIIARILWHVECKSILTNVWIENFERCRSLEWQNVNHFHSHSVAFCLPLQLTESK